MALFIGLLLLCLSLLWFLTDLLKIPLFLSLLLSLIIIAPLVYLLARSITQPIRRMTEMANRLASDGLDRGLYAYPSDELVRLAKAISEMGKQLRNKIEDISREKEYLQTILKGMKEGVLIVDEKDRIRMVNDSLRNLLPLPPEVADKMPLEVIRNADLEGAIRKVIQEGKGVALELNLPSSNGRIFEVNVVPIQSSPQAIQKGGPMIRGTIAVFHDITRLKELERMRQDFVANVSHEIRTPLTTIKGYVETLLEGALKEEVAVQFLQVIKRHTDRLTKIVEDLLMLSKIETKEFHLKLETLSLSELIDDVLDFVKEAAEKKKISISKSEIPSSLGTTADRNSLEQVFVNLLDNAIKYNHEGGKITISAGEKDQRTIQISIQDDGIGIPREDLHRIFERFYRVDKGRSQELGGTGLGLSIVKHIVQAHRGKVWAESQPGKGSIFHFTLPKPS